MTDGHVRGEGFRWIVEEAAKARFVTVGESHNLKDIPPLHRRSLRGPGGAARLRVARPGERAVRHEPGHVWTLMDFEVYVPLARAGSTDRWWVVDLREVRPYMASGAVGKVNDELRKVIFGFDLALLIGSGDRATSERLGGG